MGRHYLYFFFMLFAIINNTNAADKQLKDATSVVFSAVEFPPPAVQRSFKEYRQYYRDFRNHFIKMKRLLPEAKTLCEQILEIQTHQTYKMDHNAGISTKRLDELIQRTQNHLSIQQVAAKKFIDELDTVGLMQIIPLLTNLSSTLKTLQTIRPEEVKINIKDLDYIYSLEDIYYNYVTPKMKYLKSKIDSNPGQNIELDAEVVTIKSQIDPVCVPCIFLETKLKELMGKANTVKKHYDDLALLDRIGAK